VGCYIWYSEEGASPLLAVPNEQPTHVSSGTLNSYHTHQRPVYQLLYCYPLLCGFHVAIKGLNYLLNYKVVQKLNSFNSEVQSLE